MNLILLKMDASLWQNEKVANSVIITAKGPMFIIEFFKSDIANTIGLTAMAIFLGIPFLKMFYSAYKKISQRFSGDDD